jgi:arylsulfatase A-like enzyme
MGIWSITYPSESHLRESLRARGVLEPRRVPEVVEHTDLLPTVADLVGATSALVGQAAPAQGRSLLHGNPENTSGVRSSRGSKSADRKGTKLIHRSIGADELYHLPSDPDENKNLIDRNARRASAM